jgi:uncharacterized membrane protein YhiD involved in acid resistance
VCDAAVLATALGVGVWVTVGVGVLVAVGVALAAALGVAVAMGVGETGQRFSWMQPNASKLSPTQIKAKAKPLKFFNAITLQTLAP